MAVTNYETQLGVKVSSSVLGNVVARVGPLLRKAQYRISIVQHMSAKIPFFPNPGLCKRHLHCPKTRQYVREYSIYPTTSLLISLRLIDPLFTPTGNYPSSPSSGIWSVQFEYR